MRGLGLDVAVPRDLVLGHTCTADSFGSLMRQEMRWSRTIRSVDPAGFFGSIVTHPIPLATLAVLVSAVRPGRGLAMLGLAVTSRLLLQIIVNRAFNTGTNGLILGPVRDYAAFLVFLLGFWPGSIDWRGDRFALQTRWIDDGARQSRFLMRTLFLQAPSFDGYDGGAGARYQMKREVKSFWYPTWLAQPAALVENSKLIDAPPHKLKFSDIAPQVKDYDMVVMHTSTPSFDSDIKTAADAARPEAGPEDRLRRRQGGGGADAEPRSLFGARLRRPRRVRLHHQGSGRRPRLVEDRRHHLSATGKA